MGTKKIENKETYRYDTQDSQHQFAAYFPSESHTVVLYEHELEP
jgi:hypothetical protein